MAIFSNSPAGAKQTPSFASEPAAMPITETPPAPNDVAIPQPQSARTAAASSGKESLIAADLTIEGKIEGTGHVRIAGNFKGDVNVRGDLTIETGAKVNGGVRAQRVNVAGELEGNIDSAAKVELVDSGAISGDIKAESLTVAPGSRIRGRVECGIWNEGKTATKTNGTSNGVGHGATSGAGSRAESSTA